MTHASVERGRRALAAGSRTFDLAARLLDPRARASAYQLYAWGRHCDDVIDGQVLGHGQRPATDVTDGRARLAELWAKTEAALEGNPPPDDTYIGLAEAVARHRIPPDRPLDLLRGLALDVEGARCGTYPDLERYAWLVAGSVAAMMGYVMDAAAPPVIAGFERLGVGVQLTNIARDVMDDAAAGRVYLPLEWLAEARVPVERLADPAYRTGVAGVVARVLDRADHEFATGASAVDALPYRYRVVVLAGSTIYADIGRIVRERGPAAWDRRAFVRSPRKGWLLARAAARALGTGGARS